MGLWDIWSHGSWRDISNLRYEGDTTLMAGSEEELKKEPFDEHERGE